MRQFIAALLAAVSLGSVAFAQSEPCRPNGIDLSVRHAPGSYLLYYPESGAWHTASQQERDCMEQAKTQKVLELALLLGDLVPTGLNKAIDCFTLAYTRIQVITPYRGTLQMPYGNRWIVGPFGRDYQCEHYALRAIRYAAMGSAVRAKAAARLADKPDLRDILDVNADLTGPADYTLPAHVSSDLDTKRDDMFPVDTRKPFPPCGGGDGCVNLHEMHRIHSCIVEKRNLGYNPAVCGDLKAAHLAYERGCGSDENCHWFRRMAPFNGAIDRKWTTEQMQQWGILTDIMHHDWTEAEERGDPKATELHSRRHGIAHLCMNIGTNTRMRVVFPDPTLPASKFVQSYGGDQTCAELLPKLVAAFNVK